MGDTKITALPENTTPVGTDLLAMVDDPAGTPATQKITLANLGIIDGWTPASETWTYASASTITVPAGAAAKYAVGDRIKWTQTTVKYGVIVAVADTVLTIAVNTDYVVTNAAISANYYSHEANPIGYPTWFSWTPVFAGFSVDPTTTYCKYSIVGRYFTMIYKDGSGVSNATNFTLSLPVSIATGSTGGSMTIATDNSSRFGGGAIDSNGGTTLILYKTGGLGAWTNSGYKGSEQLLVTGAF